MHVHLVFVTKYRRGVFTKEIKIRKSKIPYWNFALL